MNEIGKNLKLEAALKYAAMGLNIIPTGPNKKPLINWKSYQDRCATPEEINVWWGQCPDANPALVTGKVSGVVALDLDKKHNRSSSEFQIPPTVCAKSGSGGEHFFFKYPIDVSVKSGAAISGEGVDCRADLGYILLAPSVNEAGGLYEWLIPFESKDDLAEMPEWFKKSTADNSSDKKWLSGKDGVIEGTRNDTAASMAGKIISSTAPELLEGLGWEQFKVWNNTNTPPIQEAELRNVWESIKKSDSEKESKGKSVKKAIRNEEDEYRFITSEILNDGTMIEMLFDSKEGESSLAVYKDGEIRNEKSFRHKGVDLKPHSAEKDLLKSRVVLFPSEPLEYESQKKLIEDIQAFIHKYLSVSDFFEKISSYYVLFSWVHDDFNELPYLRGLGDYGTGKSRFLQVVGSICYRPIFASGATTVSPIFRILNDFKGTLILDEADFKVSDTTTEIIKILNSGFMKGMPVLRSEGNNKKNFDVKAFNVFGPKIIATRQLYKDTALESRMITEDMNLNFPRKDISYNIPDSFYEEALEIRNKLLMFRFRNKGKSKIKPELENRGIEPRLNQIAIPLMSIIDDQEIIKEIQQYVVEYNEKIKTDRTLGYSFQILDAICELLDDGYFCPTIQQVTAKFNKDLFFSEQITPKKMGYLIRKTLDLKTERTREGYVISEDNKEKIEILRKRYGIKKECEDVNIVNNELEEKKEEINVEGLF